MLRLLTLVFGISGGVGLGLQLVWTRRFGLLLGHEYPAVLAVVTGFFAGLTLGAVAAGWLLRRYRALALAAALEGLIGIWALATIPLLGWLDQWSNAGASWLWPGLMLLPATGAMGATLPVFEGAWTALESKLSSTSNSHRSQRLALLYAANTTGAVVGVGLAVWILMPLLGLAKSTWVLALLSGLNGLILISLNRRFSAASKQRFESSELNPPRSIGGNSQKVELRGFAFVTGFLGLAYEVLAVRQLAQALEGTIFTYACVLMVFLGCTSLGAWIYRYGGVPWNTASGRRDRLFAFMVICVGFSGWALWKSLEFYEGLRAQLGESLISVVVAECLVAASVLGLPAIGMGAVFSNLVGSSAGGMARTNELVAWNLLGATLAPGVVGAWIFPSVGGRWTLLGIGIGYSLCLMISTYCGKKKGAARVAGPLVVAALALGGAVLGLPQLDLQLVPPGHRLVEVREDAADTVSVLEPSPGQRTLRVNNRFTMGGTASAVAEQRHSHIPLLLHPRPRQALFLGVGTGISYAAMGLHPELEAEGVELVSSVLAVQSHFAPQNSLSQRQRLILGDARSYVRRSNKKYDVIVADLFHPGRDGAGALYTREHFEAVRHRLQTEGLFCQWLPLYQLDAPTLRCIVRTFLEVFPDTDAFWLRPNVDVPVLGLVGWMQRPRFSSDWVAKRVEAAPPALRDAWRRTGLVNELQLFGLWFADAAALGTWSEREKALLNTDDLPWVQFTAPRATYARTTPPYQLMLELLRSNQKSHLPAWISELDSSRAGSVGRAKDAGSQGISVKGRFLSYTVARDLYLQGLIQETRGQAAEAEAQYLASVRASADFTTSYAQLISRASILLRNDPVGGRRILETLAQIRPEVPVAAQMLERHSK